MEQKGPQSKNYLESAGYLGLKKEVLGSAREVLTSEGEDIEPVFKLFDSALAEKQIDGVTREKMFWDVVGEALKDNVFEEISRAVEQPVEEGKYEEAEKIIHERMIAAIKKLSPTIFRNLSKRDFARAILKDKFYSYVPDLAALLKDVGKDKKAKIKIPTGRTEQETMEMGVGPAIWPKLNKETSESLPQFIGSRSWPIPSGEELKPGMILEVEDIRTKEVLTYRIMHAPIPYKPDDPAYKGSRSIRLKQAGGDVETEHRLAALGIEPYSGSLKGDWSGWFRPVKWYPETENLPKKKF